VRSAPTDIKLKRSQNLLEVTWRQAGVRRHRVRVLRCACRCAVCVDEHTGQKLLDDGTVPDDIGITDMQLVGNYAVRFTFSDGHDTGIYTWERLFELDEQPQSNG